MSQAETPNGLKAYEFHGLEFKVSHEHGVAECPKCGKAKFYVNVTNGLWDCKVCLSKGNPIEFLRMLKEMADSKQGTAELAQAKSLLFEDTPKEWGVFASPINGEWLVPGYGADGSLHQLYRYVSNNILYPTPGLEEKEKMGLFGLGLWDNSKSTVYVCEGPWDGMALYELLKVTKYTDAGTTALTGAERSSLYAGANVVSVPGAGTFYPSWAKLMTGKHVIFMYDNDHPGVNSKTGAAIPPTGLMGMMKAASVVMYNSKPASVSYLKWGEAGYDLNWKSGGDVRDFLSAPGNKPTDRAKVLGSLLEKIVKTPDEWYNKERGKLEDQQNTTACDSWVSLQTKWKKAMRWRQDMDDVFSVMLAVAVSTDQKGDQLFLQVIGDAGSGKTRLCDAMIKSSHCHALEHLTGFHSGWVSEDGKDYSLINRVNGKTLITPEGDVLMSSPHFVEIMSQQRRIFDGKSGASYKNKDTDKVYENLRTPWIIAGTWALVNTDQTRLGDRFLRVCIDQPDHNEKREIMRRVGFSTIRAVPVSTENKSTINDEQLNAYMSTGGYINYLRDNAARLLAEVETNMDAESVEDYCCNLAEFVALMRARPYGGKADLETKNSIEMPTRLHAQFIRLTMCLGAVLGKKTVDADVLRRTRKVCLDTARGRMLDLVKHLYESGEDALLGNDVKSIQTRMSLEYVKVMALLKFLRDVDAAEAYKEPGKGVTKWRLTGRVKDLYERVVVNC